MSGPVIGAAEGMARLVAELDRPPFHSVLQPFAKHYDADSGAVRVGLKYQPEFSYSRQGDYYHGGVIASLIDLAGHAVVAVQIGETAPTIDLRIDYLRPASGELTASARLLKLGRTFACAQVEVSDGAGTLVAVGVGTFSSSVA